MGYSCVRPRGYLSLNLPQASLVNPQPRLPPFLRLITRFLLLHIDLSDNMKGRANSQ
jgi:hypothetical protein